MRFHRLLSHRALLYTEMVTADAVLHGDQERLIGPSGQTGPVALQLGGADPQKLAEAAQIGQSFGYEEINLNVGCPSGRVQDGRFGACLMGDPRLVGRCVRAMGDSVRVPVTVKCRIGIDDQDSEADFQRFIDVVAGEGGTRTFAVHARKAWLSGLSPKENREVPPLDYDRVYRLKASRPELEIILNGGITTIDEARSHLAHVDGVMVGRAAYQTPHLLAQVDAVFFGTDSPALSRKSVLLALMGYVDNHIAGGGRLNNITRHILGLYHGQPRARAFRRHLSINATGPEAGSHVLAEAIDIAEGGRFGRQRRARHDPVRFSGYRGLLLDIAR